MSRTTGDVLANEFYPTPDVVVDALLAKVSFRETDLFCEPCKGAGAIFDKVPLPYYQKLYAELAEGIDYLATGFPKFDVIITNPPFSLTEEFIEKALSELKEDGTLIMLQRVNYLGSIKRIKFWQRVTFPEKLPIIVPRPRFAGGRSDSCEYAWFIWDRGGRVDLPDGLSHLISVDIA